MYSKLHLALIRRVTRVSLKLEARMKRLSTRLIEAKKGWVTYRHNFNHYIKFRAGTLKREEVWKQKYTTLAHQVEMHNINFGHLRFVRLSTAHVGDQVILKVSRDERLKLKELLKRRKHARRR